ncbi:MAG: peptidoglycan-binding protein [Melioribacteraceae bacterium]|nr:peptidoglycan-binding protein [Melioribacteraceae bacterium]
MASRHYIAFFALIIAVSFNYPAMAQSNSSFGEFLKQGLGTLQQKLQQQQLQKEIPAPQVNQQQPVKYDQQMVMDAQAMLNSLGYDAGPADGLFGNRTKIAIQNFQRDYGLQVNGRPSQYLISNLQKNGGTLNAASAQAPAAQTVEKTAQAPTAPHQPAEKKPFDFDQTGSLVSSDECAAVPALREKLYARIKEVTDQMAKHSCGKEVNKYTVNGYILEFSKYGEKINIKYSAIKGFFEASLGESKMKYASSCISKKGSYFLRVHKDVQNKLRQDFASTGNISECTESDISGSAQDGAGSTPPSPLMHERDDAQTNAGENRKRTENRATAASKVPPVSISIPPETKHEFDIQKIRNPKGRSIVQAFYDDCQRGNLLTKYFDCSCVAEELTVGIFSGEIPAAEKNVSLKAFERVEAKKICLNDHGIFMENYNSCYRMNYSKRSIADPQKYCQCYADRFLKIFKENPRAHMDYISDASMKAFGLCREYT